MNYVSYEDAIRERAERLGFEVERSGGGLLVMDDDGGSCWHRLGGVAEAAHDRRQDEGLTEPGRWAGLQEVGETWVPWSQSLRSAGEPA